MGSIIGGEPGADVIQASRQASWADPVWVEMSKHTEGQHYLQLQCQPWPEWGCSFTADVCRQFYHGVCFIAPWGTDIVHHYLFRMGVSCSSTVDCIGKQLVTQGCFLSADLYYVSSLPLFLASVMGGLHSSIRLSGMFAHSTGAAALCMPVASYGTAIASGVPCRTVVMAREVWAGAVGALLGTLLWLALLRLTVSVEGMDDLAGTQCSCSRFNSVICATHLQ